MMSSTHLGRILLVEDEIADATLVVRALGNSGVQNPLVMLRNADEALAYLEGINGYADRIAHPLPILILLDLKLPGMPGLQLLKWIRTRRDLRLIPVVILTGSHDDADVKHAYEAGANSFLRKRQQQTSFTNSRTFFNNTGCKTMYRRLWSCVRKSETC